MYVIAAQDITRRSEVYKSNVQVASALEHRTESSRSQRQSFRNATPARDLCENPIKRNVRIFRKRVERMPARTSVLFILAFSF